MAKLMAKQMEIDKKFPTALLSYDVPMPAYEFICMYLIAQIVHEVEPDKKGFHQLPVKLVRMMTGDHGKNKDYRRYHQAINFLSDTSIKWNVAREDNTIDTFRASLISTKKTNSKNNNPLFRVNEDIVNLIKTTKVFSPMNLLMLAIFSYNKSSYPLYMYLFDALSRGATSVTLSLVQIKTICGVGEREYEDDFKGFNKRHLRPKTEFIIRNSDVCFEYKSFREGRKIGGVEFYDIRFQDWQQILFSDTGKHDIADEIMALAREIDLALKTETERTVSDQYFKKLIEPKRELAENEGEILSRYSKYGISKKKITELIKNPKVGTQGLVEILDACERDVARRENTDNPIRDANKHVYWAINSGWHEDGYGIKSQEERDEKAKAQKQRVERENKERIKLEDALDYHIAIKKHDLEVEAFIESLLVLSEKETSLTDLLEEFIDTLSFKWERIDAKKNGFQSRINQRHVCSFLASRHSIDEPVLDIKDDEKRRKEYEKIKDIEKYSPLFDKASSILSDNSDLDTNEIIDTVLQ